MKKSIFLLVLVNMSLSACAMQEGDFPSLAKRPFEDAPAGIDPIGPAPPPLILSLPGPLQAEVNRAVEQSNAAHAEFLSKLPAVQRRVDAARGAAVSSESWVVSQMDLSALEIVRSPSVSALADLDSLYVTRLNAEYDDKERGGAALIGIKRLEVSAQVKRQQDDIDAMKAKMR